MLWFLCRDTQGKEQQVEKGLLREPHGLCGSQQHIRGGGRLQRCPQQEHSPRLPHGQLFSSA